MTTLEVLMFVGLLCLGCLGGLLYLVLRAVDRRNAIALEALRYRRQQYVQDSDLYQLTMDELAKEEDIANLPTKDLTPKQTGELN